MPTYGERARVFWRSLSPADRKRIHGFLAIDGSASWKFDADKIADLCESHPEIPFALRAMIPTGKFTASPNENSDDCVARAAQVLEHAEIVSRSIPNRFGEVVPQDVYKRIQTWLVKGRRVRGWRGVPLATITKIVDFYAFSATITPPGVHETIGEGTRAGNLRMLWEGAKFWSAPRDCGRIQCLLSMIEREVPHSMKPVIKEEHTLADKAAARVAALKDELEDATSRMDQVSQRLKTATSAREIQNLEDKLSSWDRTRRDLCERIQIQEARAKYLRWGGRPLGHFDPSIELQKRVLDLEAEQDDTAITRD